MTKKYLTLIAFIAIICASCKKENDTTQYISINTLYPFTVGKVFIYRYDSTVSLNFGKTLSTISYIAKDSIESTFTDINGNTSYRIFRYLTDTLQSQPWQYMETNVATIKNNSIEYIENNLRFIKLSSPVTTNVTWRGNAYINTDDLSPYHYYDKWDFRYEKIDEPFACLKQTYDSTYTVFQIDEQTPTIFDAQVYNSKKYSKEVYAKNVGLIYKEILYWVWQPSGAKFQDDAFGVKMNLIEIR